MIPSRHWLLLALLAVPLAPLLAADGVSVQRLAEKLGAKKSRRLIFMFLPLIFLPANRVCKSQCCQRLMLPNAVSQGGRSSALDDRRAPGYAVQDPAVSAVG